LANRTPQKYKRSKKSKDNNEDYAITKFPHLTELCLLEAHDDYVMQFLDDTKTCLSNSVHAYIYYRSLKRVTQNLIRKATRVNCVKLKQLHVFGEFKICKPFTGYFSHINI
jgi:hypothetical protein